jgi:hypothetical protein
MVLIKNKQNQLFKWVIKFITSLNLLQIKIFIAMILKFSQNLNPLLNLFKYRAFNIFCVLFQVLSKISSKILLALLRVQTFTKSDCVMKLLILIRPQQVNVYISSISLWLQNNLRQLMNLVNDKMIIINHWRFYDSSY